MVWNLFPESGAPLAQTRFQPSCSLNLRFPQKSQFLETYCFNSLIGKGRGTNDDTGEINVPSWSFKSFNNLKMESKRCLGPNLLEHRRKITGQARYKSSHPSGGEQRKERGKSHAVWVKNSMKVSHMMDKQPHCWEGNMTVRMKRPRAPE